MKILQTLYVPCFLHILIVNYNKSMSSLLTAKVAKSRGVFILFEGIDRCGKSTQAAMINDYLLKSSKTSELIRFPDRTSSIGQLINSYLQSTSQLSDHAIHLLFSANRWESSHSLISKLESGVSLVSYYYLKLILIKLIMIIIETFVLILIC